MDRWSSVCKSEGGYGESQLFQKYNKQGQYFEWGKRWWHQHFKGGKNFVHCLMGMEGVVDKIPKVTYGQYWVIKWEG